MVDTGGWHYWQRWEQELCHEISIHHVFLSLISMDSWEWMVFSLVFLRGHGDILLQKGYLAGETWPEFFFWLKICSMSYGIGLWPKLQVLIFKKILPISTSASQVLAKRDLFDWGCFLFDQEYKMGSWIFHNRIKFIFHANIKSLTFGQPENIC